MHSSVDEIARLYQHYRDLDITPYVTQVSQKPHGFGGLANVHTAMWFMPYHERPQKVAVKLLRCASVPDERVIKRLRKEIGVWRRLEHANVQQLSGLRWSNSGLPAMVSLWHDYGDINSYIAKIKPHLSAQILDETKVDLFADVARGLDYLHRNGVIHADIKGANVLVSADKTARLCDFGFSWILAGDALSFSDPSSTLKGTVRWMAPELVEDDAKHTKESDIWAYGCLILEVQGECRPYYNKTNDVAVYVALGQKLQPSLPQTLQSDAVWALVLSCCTLDALRRPKAGELLVHCQTLRRGQSAQPQPQSSIVGDKQHAQPRSVRSPSEQGVRAMKGSDRQEEEDEGIRFAEEDETYDSSPWFGGVGHSVSPDPPNVSHRSPSEHGVRGMKGSEQHGEEDEGIRFAEEDETYDSSPWFGEVGPSVSPNPRNISQKRSPVTFAEDDEADGIRFAEDDETYDSSPWFGEVVPSASPNPRSISQKTSLVTFAEDDETYDSSPWFAGIPASVSPNSQHVSQRMFSAPAAVFSRLRRDADWDSIDVPAANPAWRRVRRKGTSAHTAAVGRDGLEYEDRDTPPSWRRVWDSIDIPSTNPPWQRVPRKDTSAHTAAVGRDGLELEEPPARTSWRRVPQNGSRARKSAADTGHDHFLLSYFDPV